MGGGGGFKEMILEGDVGDYIGDMMKGRNMCGVIMGWLITGLIGIGRGEGVV